MDNISLLDGSKMSISTCSYHTTSEESGKYSNGDWLVYCHLNGKWWKGKMFGLTKQSSLVFKKPASVTKHL